MTSLPDTTHVPETMKAIAITRPGGPEVLTLCEEPTPVPGKGQLLIRVEAAGVNRPDILQREGTYPPPEGHSPLPGLEVAGEVVALGDEVSRYRLGDRVTALVNGGGYAQYCLADVGAALPFPEGLDFIAAAALPETVFTVWHNVFERGRLVAGEWLLVHGGASGIGTTAIQIAHALGAKVLATAGSNEKCRKCEALGATRAINYRREDFVEVTKTVAGGANVILDMVGGSYIARNIKAAAPEGRIVQIAFLEGAVAEVNFAPLMLKRLTLTGSTLRARSRAFKAALATAVETNVWPLIAEGRVKPVIDSVFDLAEAADAHRRMEAGAHIGKIVLRVRHHDEAR